MSINSVYSCSSSNIQPTILHSISQPSRYHSNPSEPKQLQKPGPPSHLHILKPRTSASWATSPCHLPPQSHAQESSISTSRCPTTLISRAVTETLPQPLKRIMNGEMKGGISYLQRLIVMGSLSLRRQATLAGVKLQRARSSRRGGWRRRRHTRSGRVDAFAVCWYWK